MRNLNIVSYLTRISLMYKNEKDMTRVFAYSKAARNLTEYFGDTLGDTVTISFDYSIVEGVGPAINKKINDMVDGNPRWSNKELPQEEYPELTDTSAKWLADHKIMSPKDAVILIRSGVSAPTSLIRELGYQRAEWWDGSIKYIVDEINSYHEGIANVAGSHLRKCNIVHDLDFVVHMTYFDFQAFVEKHGNLIEIIGDGVRRVRCRITNSGGNVIEADFRLVRDIGEYIYTLLYFTGSMGHNIKMRSRAKSLGWTLNEYGLWDDAGIRIPNIKCETELFEKLEMQYKLPEDR